MYGIRRTTAKVCDAAPPYGGQSREDRYPADEVLDDLPTAADGAAVARVLARYAALRHWLLRAEAAPSSLTTHAEAAARAHLAAAANGGAGGAVAGAVADDWAEGEMLSRLAEAPLWQAAGLLASAAAEAARAGDRSGAAALDAAARDAVRRDARRGRRPPPP